MEYAEGGSLYNCKCTHVKDVIISLSQVWENKNLDHYTFLGNCLPTPPLRQHFALSER